jgi:hypothetical protein
VPEDEVTANIDPQTGWAGGFSCIVGNPPWERIAFGDDEFFSSRAPEVLETKTTAERKAAIAAKLGLDPTLRVEYWSERRRREEVSHFIVGCSLFPLTATGRLTMQAPFVEASLRIVSPAGRSGLIIPTSVLTAVPMKTFWGWLVQERRLRGLLDMENSKGIFPAVHRSTKFTLLTLGGQPGRAATDKLRLGVFIQTPEELANPNRVYDFPLTALEEINPDTKQLPICRSRRDVELLVKLSRGVVPHLTVTPWVGLTSDAYSKHYEYARTQKNVPLYEGKLIHQYDSCFASYEGVSTDDLPDGKPAPVPASKKVRGATTRFFLAIDLVNTFLARKNVGDDWVLVIRDYVRSTDDRTAIATVIPRSAPIQPLNGFTVRGGVGVQAWVLGAINTWPYEFMAKQKTPGQHFNVTIMSQIPVPSVDEAWHEFVVHRVLELCYVSPLLVSFAKALGDGGAPFCWDDERRRLLRAELDAAFFHLYGIERDDVDYIMDTFPIVKRKDMAAFGSYRTKDLVLEVYDAMTQAIRTGEPYKTILELPPGQGPRHPESSRPV